MLNENNSLKRRWFLRKIYESNIALAMRQSWLRGLYPDEPITASEEFGCVMSGTIIYKTSEYAPIPRVGVLVDNTNYARMVAREFCADLHPRSRKGKWDLVSIVIHVALEGIDIKETIERAQSQSIRFIGLDLKWPARREKQIKPMEEEEDNFPFD